MLKYIMAKTGADKIHPFVKNMGMIIRAGVWILPVAKPSKNPMTTQRSTGGI